MIYIASDDSGYEAKITVIEYLKENKIEFIDCGSDDEPSRYPYFAARAAAAVSRGAAEKAILICGSGVGMSITANKFKGVRAALVSEPYSARLTRRHNDSNILCLGGRLIGRWMLLEIVDTWLNTEYDGGHHDGSLELIRLIEEENMTGSQWLPEELPYEPFEWNPEQKL